MDTNALVPMTELEAINEMLSVISESPVASLEEAASVADAQSAQQLLGRQSRSVQSIGWQWNTEYNFRLAPDIDGNIILPANTVKVDPVDPSIDYVFRQGKLWDRQNKTFTIPQAVLVNIVFLLPFEDLPSTARTFITAAAARKFENRLGGDAGSNQINTSDAMAAWAELLQEECDDANYNVVRDSPTINRIAVRMRP